MSTTDQPAPQSSDQLIDDLRHTLNHLYDPDYLAESPLCGFLGITGQYSRAPRLQRALEEAIDGLKPKVTTASGSRSWRVYQLLSGRYLQCLSQKEVADQLNISVSQLVREQKAALCALASHIWETYDLDARTDEVLPPSTGTGPVSPLAGRDDELAWLAQPSARGPADLVQSLRQALQLAGSLLARYQVDLLEHVPTRLPGLAVSPVALRQIVLTLLNAGAHFAARGSVSISATGTAESDTLTIACTRPAGHSDDAPDEWSESLAVACRLAELCGGDLRLEESRTRLQAVLALPTLASVPVLLIDDSFDNTHLLERFTAHTRYRLFGLQEAHRAVERALQTQARIVILDIMMPRTDGWSVMEALRSHEATARLPVVVCSILPLDELSLSLGADAFLRKPVSQELFLATLDRLIAPDPARS